MSPFMEKSIDKSSSDGNLAIPSFTQPQNTASPARVRASTAAPRDRARTQDLLLAENASPRDLVATEILTTETSYNISLEKLINVRQ